MDFGVSDSLGGAFPNKVYTTMEIRACGITLVHPCREDNLLDSCVHGNMMLYDEARSYHYKLYLYTCWFRVFLPRGDVEEGISEAWLMYTTYYYTMLQQLLLHCYFMLYMNCWLILLSCCKTRRKMLVFDRLSLFPLTLVLLSCSPLYSLPFHLIQLHIA